MTTQLSVTEEPPAASKEEKPEEEVGQPLARLLHVQSPESVAKTWKIHPENCYEQIYDLMEMYKVTVNP